MSPRAAQAVRHAVKGWEVLDIVNLQGVLQDFAERSRRCAYTFVNKCIHVALLVDQRLREASSPPGASPPPQWSQLPMPGLRDILVSMAHVRHWGDVVDVLAAVEDAWKVDDVEEQVGGLPGEPACAAWWTHVPAPTDASCPTQGDMLFGLLMGPSQPLPQPQQPSQSLQKLCADVDALTETAATWQEPPGALLGLPEPPELCDTCTSPLKKKKKKRRRRVEATCEAAPCSSTAVPSSCTVMPGYSMLQMLANSMVLRHS